MISVLLQQAMEDQLPIMIMYKYSKVKRIYIPFAMIESESSLCRQRNHCAETLKRVKKRGERDFYIWAKLLGVTYIGPNSNFYRFQNRTEIDNVFIFLTG